ncbi:MAG: dihydropteroate synthase [Chthoniobacterales bacterium]|nr:dihydropteroate synthase [Chthoniobacterales bacterium]
MIWRTSRRTFDLTDHGAIMGVINVTPDSFSDGGTFADAHAAIEHGIRLADEGAAILDIGGESTRPGAEPIPAWEELRRILPVVKGLAGKTSAALSIDTSKAEVARAAMDAGAEIINDVTALQGDARMAAVAAATGAAVVLMHMRGTPRTMQKSPDYADVAAEVLSFLTERLVFAQAAGIESDRMAVDPGIGFGKTTEHNLQLIASLPRFCPTGRPVVLGVSRKSFLASAAGCPDLPDRDAPTAALTSLGRELGARIFRVHAVRENAQALRMTEAILGATPENA